MARDLPRVWEYEAVAETRANTGIGEEARERGGQEVRELAQGAGGPGIDLKVLGKRRGGGGGELVGPVELLSVRWWIHSGQEGEVLCAGAKAFSCAMGGTEHTCGNRQPGRTA